MPEMPCGVRSWAKVKGYTVGAVRRVSEPPRYDIEGDASVGWWHKGGQVPDHDSAEWLADIVEALETVFFLRNAEGEVAVAALGWHSPEGVVAKTRRAALCTALNGEPCQWEGTTRHNEAPSS